MSLPRVSIVTISFNQAEFLERAIRSVLEQDYPEIEYIVVDAGSTDGSREIIERYADQISHVIFEPDEGPADGLNKGFEKATGEIFGFLNSDDVLMSDALREAVAYMEEHPDVDVVSGHSLIISQDDRILRKGYSGRFGLRRYAYDGVELMQASTFFRRSPFQKVGGFNKDNRSSWDGELFVDMALNGARFELVRAFWSGFRLHSESITASKKLREEMRVDRQRIFIKIVGREENVLDKLRALGTRFWKHLRNPRATYERITKGPIYGVVPRQEL